MDLPSIPQPRCQVRMFSHGRLKVVQVWVLDLKNLKLHKLNLIAFLKGDVQRVLGWVRILQQIFSQGVLLVRCHEFNQTTKDIRPQTGVT